MTNNNLPLPQLLTFLNSSPTAWHATENAVTQLKDNGFHALDETKEWNLKPGQGYFVTRNGSSLCAFVLPKKAPQRVRMLASHSDSPALKLKPKTEIKRQNMISFGVEIYGSPLLSSWLNRDLGIAGRIIYFDEDHLPKTALVNLTEHPLVIPQLAIHLDREVNEKGLILNKQEHLNALACLTEDNSNNYLEKLLKTKLKFKQLISSDLFLYPLEPARLIGFENQLISSYRLDNLASFNASLTVLMHDLSPLEEDIKMIASWDNEEIGSHTSHGASSPFIAQILERILLSYNKNRSDYFCLINKSLCVSIDMAHALNPNYMERHDPQHHLLLGKGVVIKGNAQFRYASDALSIAPVEIIAKENNIKLQKFVSRNDIPCGTTIGPIHASQVGMPTVDIGCAQLSMHSSREVIAAQDYMSLCDLLKTVLEKEILPIPVVVA